MFFSSSASRQRYVNVEQSPGRQRGTQEYNPLYDAFDSNPVNPIRTGSTGFSQAPGINFDNAYDKPRAYAPNEPPTDERILEARSLFNQKSGKR